MKKKDIWLVLGVLLLAGALWIVPRMFLDRSGSTLVIEVSGEKYGSYSLDEDQVIEINETNVCEIKDGSVRMISAKCPDHLCIKQRTIDKSGGTIVCLPNKVVLEIVNTGNDAEQKLDEVVQ